MTEVGSALNQGLPYLGLAMLGVAVGAYGTLIGAGGGFVLVPVLLLLYPDRTPAQLTAISLAVVWANASAGSLSYYRLHRADYRSGIWLALATVPGAVIGAIFIGAVPRGTFQWAMGLVLIAVGSFLIARPKGRIPLLVGAPMTVRRRIVDSAGEVHTYRFNLGLAMLASTGVGFLSSLLGIGGGIVHVPALTTFFEFPEHVATATSHFVLVFTSGSGAITHLLEGDYASTLGVTVALALGVLAGAPIGAEISGKIAGAWIIRLLAVALGVVGLRLLI